MELGLCLGDSTNTISFIEKPSKINSNRSPSTTSTSDKDLGTFCMGLDVGFGGHKSRSSSSSPSVKDSDGFKVSSWVDPSLQLQLHFPHNIKSVPNMSVPPPDSVTSSFQLDFGIKRYSYERRISNKKDMNDEVERSANEDNNDDVINGTTRKKLRLTKDQSAFLEDSFKEHITLNPRQKVALAKQLKLRPRQVEVWFQNRRARTKLKQTEVDCEYLKTCCKSLTEENRRLHKEVKELRALKTSSPFYLQLPATTLTMCPSCERVATSAPQPSTSASHNLGLSTSSFHSPLIPVKPQPAKQVS